MKAFIVYDCFGNELPKTHFNRKCNVCIETQCGCSLPFRRMSKYSRKHMAMETYRKMSIGGRFM